MLDGKIQPLLALGIIKWSHQNITKKLSCPGHKVRVFCGQISAIFITTQWYHQARTVNLLQSRHPPVGPWCVTIASPPGWSVVCYNRVTPRRSSALGSIDILYHRRSIGCCDARDLAAILVWITNWQLTGRVYIWRQGCRWAGVQRIPAQMSGPSKIGIGGLLFTSNC